MKRALPTLVVALALVVPLALLVSACGDDEAGVTLLTVTGPTGTVELTLADMEDLPVTEGWGGFVSSTGSISIPEQFRGVSLADLAAQVGGITEGMGLTVTAKDGYSMTLSYEQAVDGDFITYDPSTGDEITPPGLLRPILAYSVGGQPLGEDQGPLRLEVVSDERKQVIDGHWTVKWVTGLEIKAMGEEWTLGLEGLTSETMDRGTYESCLSCHGVTWTDGDGGEWEGVPLWMMAARLDGGEAHGEDPYDEGLAQAGYTLEVIAADGYSATLDSALFDRNDDILVAGRLNGEALAEEDFPLRLVGEGLSGRDMVAQIVQIIGHFAGAGDDGEDGGQATPAPDAAVAITGAVTTEFTLSAATLGQLQVVTATLTDPDGNSGEYTGVLFADLLALLVPQAEATTLQVTASDGYSISLALADVRACRDCMVYICPEGRFELAMPGMEGRFWVSDVASIEVG